MIICLTLVLNIGNMMRIMPFCRVFDIRSLLDKSVVKNTVSAKKKLRIVIHGP